MSRNINPVPCLFFQAGNIPLTSLSTIWRKRWSSVFANGHRPCPLVRDFPPRFAQDAPPAKASAQAGSIHGTISTMQDNALSGVAGISVKLSGGLLHGAPLSADTDEHGGYEFKNLEPGTYTISITLQGFKSITKPVGLSPKQQLVQDFTLELEVVAEKVEVKETAHLYRHGRTAAPPPATVPNADEIISIPTPQEKVKDILPFTPGVIKTLDSKLTFKGRRRKSELVAGQFRSDHRSGHRQFWCPHPDGCGRILRRLQNAVRFQPGQFFRRIDHH